MSSTSEITLLTQTYLLFLRIQHISFLVIANMYVAFEFNLCTFSSVSFQKGQILQHNRMSGNEVVYVLYVYVVYTPLHAV